MVFPWFFPWFSQVHSRTPRPFDVPRIPGADVALNGGASWRRLLAEVEVAVRLAHPPQEGSPEVFHGIFVENKGHRGHEKPIPSGDVNIAIENCHRNSGFTH